MNEVLTLRRQALSGEKITAGETCRLLMDHVMKVTALKRSLLEEGLLEAAGLAESERAPFQAALRERALKVRGKLDHASIVAFDVGIYK